MTDLTNQEIDDIFNLKIEDHRFSRRMFAKSCARALVNKTITPTRRTALEALGLIGDNGVLMKGKRLIFSELA